MRTAADLRNGARRVEVEWIDSGAELGWNDEETVLVSVERKDYGLCISVGYLVNEDDDKVALAQSIATSGKTTRQLGDVISIPKVAVVSGPRDLRR